MQKQSDHILASKASPLMDLYDVQFYDLRLDFQPDILRLDGTTLIRADVLATSMNTMVLNLKYNMLVTEVRSDGVVVTQLDPSEDGDDPPLERLERRDVRTYGKVRLLFHAPVAS